MSDPQKTDSIPSFLHSYDKETIKLIDHCMVMLPVIRKRLLSGIEMMDVGVQAQTFEEPISHSSTLSDPVGEIVVDPRRGKRRSNIKRTREAIQRLHKFAMDALDAATSSVL